MFTDCCWTQPQPCYGPERGILEGKSVRLGPGVEWLGIPRENLHEKKLSPLPQKLRLDPSLKIVSICSGPLSHHTFLIVSRTAGTESRGGYPGTATARESLSPRASLGPLRHSLHTAIDADELLHALRSLKGSEGIQQTALVKAVGAAFSSVSVLNASFRRPSPLGTTAESSGVDLLKVRKAYHTLVFELRNARIDQYARKSHCFHL